MNDSQSQIHTWIAKDNPTTPVQMIKVTIEGA
jgi:hypothetical protein